jgi:hypothetical protein
MREKRGSHFWAFLGFAMNEAALRTAVKELLEYEASTELRPTADNRSNKFSTRLSPAYHDLLNRLSIVESATKTEIVKRALDLYAKQFGRLLFP